MTKIRILIADDSIVMRQLLKRVLESDPDLEVVATAPNGAVALEKLGLTEVDLLVSDVEMPEMDGLELVAAVHKMRPQLPIIMFSSVTERGAAVTIEALARGATDYETKPQSRGLGTSWSDEIGARLIAKVKLLSRPGRRAAISRLAGQPAPPPPPPAPRRTRRKLSRSASRRAGRTHSRRYSRVFQARFRFRLSSYNTCHRCSPNRWPTHSTGSVPYGLRRRRMATSSHPARRSSPPAGTI